MASARSTWIQLCEAFSNTRFSPCETDAHMVPPTAYGRTTGYLESFKLGGIELRNVPVGWSESESGEDVGTDSDGMIGTWVFYHLLTTFDYAGRSLILRRPTPETAAKVRADAERAGAKPVPLWLAREQYVHSTGSFAGSGARVVGVNFGGGSEHAAVLVGTPPGC